MSQILKKMSLILKIISLIFVHVILQGYGLYTDGHLIYDLWSKDHRLYAVGMVCCYFAPGFIEIIHWIWTFCQGDCTPLELLLWICFSLCFPVGVVVFNAFHACQGPTHFKKVSAQVKIINSISTLTKSPMQMILQATVILMEWKGEDEFEHWNHLVSFTVHGCMFIFHMIEHYFFEVSGKGKQTFFYWRAVIQMPFFMAFHFLVRCLAISVFIMYLRAVVLAFFFVLAFGNFLIANYTLRTHWIKDIFTSFSGIFMPESAFFSRDDFKSSVETQKKFRTFAIWNSILFFASVFVTQMILAICFVCLPDLFSFDCDSHPPFTENKECGIDQSIIFDLIGTVFPGGGFLWINIFLFLFNLADVGAVCIEGLLV